MFLVVGLGNPGSEYAGNRHNAGFLVVDRLRARNRLGKLERRFSGKTVTGTIEGEKVVLLQPTTYMNRSGRSVQRASTFHGIGMDHTVVVHDDIDLPFGTVRVKHGGGTGGHKGLRSIHDCLSTDAYSRVRVGIGRPTGASAEDWVLEDFSDEERKALGGIVELAANAVTWVIAKGVGSAMNEFNGRHTTEG